MRKTLLCFVLMMLVIPIASAYPIGIAPSTQKVCAEGGTHKIVYFNFQSGSEVNKTFTVQLKNLTWVSFYNDTLIQTGTMDVEANSSVDIQIYAVIPSNLQDGIYKATLSICTIPPENDTINLIYCLPAIIEFNVTSNCTQPINADYKSTVTEVNGGDGHLNISWIIPYLIIIIAAAVVLGLKKFKKF